MTKIEELNKELDELQAKINEVQKKIEEAKQAEWPQCGDIYWYISSDSSVISVCWHKDSIDRNHAGIGNVFKTREEAVFELERLKVTAELKKFAMSREELKDARHRQSVYYICLDPNNNLYAYSECAYRTPIIYFADEHTVFEAIRAVGEDKIKKYYFGVEE